jgi:hypothetical protein
MVALLLIVLVCLVLTVWMAARLVLDAHRRAGREDLRTAASSVDETLVEVHPAAWNPPTDAPPVTFREDPPLVSAFDGNGDVYADPIDGVPFARGEFTIPCRCGVAYRAESLDWLAGHCEGRCVLCGSPVEAGLGCLP